ncbi:MAG: 30S ribosome-binding factor RbfA [Planctomycetota bacterium]
MSHRVAQVESTLQRAVATVLQREVNDPRITGLVSVTKVDVSPDLRDARIFVSVLPEQHASKTLHGLRDAAIHIQSRVKKRVALRVVPHFDFRLDDGLKKEAAVLDAINQGMQRTGNAEPQTDSETTPES